MNEYSIRLAKPHCEKCHKPKWNSLSLDEIETIKNEIKEFIPDKQPSAVENLRSRLAGVMHGNLAGKPDDEEDI